MLHVVAGVRRILAARDSVCYANHLIGEETDVKFARALPFFPLLFLGNLHVSLIPVIDNAGSLVVQNESRHLAGRLFRFFFLAFLFPSSPPSPPQK